MKLEELRAARRPDGDWDPFMRTLRNRMRQERQRRAFSWVAAAALFVAVLGGLWLAPRGSRPGPSLRADIPAISSPVFTPASGTAVAISGGTILVIPEART